MLNECFTEKDRIAVERFLSEWVADNRIPGAAVAIIDGTATVYTEGFGARDLETDTPATPDTLFGFASCTKSFTAAAIMQLLERGDIALDDHVDEYVTHLADAPGEPITIEELLTHTSGMVSDGLDAAILARGTGINETAVPVSSDADIRRHIQSSTDQRVTDRETFAYYNTGYNVLGKVIESITDTSFGAYVDENILEPLGMERSTFDRKAFEDDDDRMTPYLMEDGSPKEAEFPFKSFTQPAGGLISSVREMTNALQMYAGARTDDETAVLSPESVASMTTPASTLGTFVDGSEIQYGFGLMIEEFLDDRLVGHPGGLPVSNAWFGYLEDAELGVVLACNGSPTPPPMSTGKAVLALLRGENPKEVVPGHRVMATLGKAAGTYEGHRGIFSATVEQVGGALQVEIDDGMSTSVLPIVPTKIGDDTLLGETVRPPGIKREVRFEFTDDGADLFLDRVRLRRGD